MTAKSFLPSSRTLAPDDQPKVFNSEPVAFHSQLFSDALNKVRVDGMTLSTKSDISSNRPESAKRKHPSNRSSNALHKAEVAPRHGDMWTGADSPLWTKSFILHSDRHQWDELFGNISKENADVYQELKRLKSMVLPAVARDLYVGRGFKLPKLVHIRV
ncbi:hypothetical protein LSH36_9g14003 [Paralvinella palmiformis]|uniref:Uncharacterized protein n=1 Tax=Paralvinella palmiformis TaxID=53620 RepID=A0AAD9KDX3_9ANNE|nr:hypothetical protein LSH36_9g14003 [Paralvinella palmiformis]